MSANNWKFSAATLSKLSELTGPGFTSGYTGAWLGSIPFTTLKKAWEEQKGTFLFLKATWDEINTAAFTQQLSVYLKAAQRADTSFLWIENPLEPVHLWKTNRLATAALTGGIQVSQRTYLDIRNYAFSLARYTEVSLTGSTFEFKRATEHPGPHAFELSAGFGIHRFYGIEKVSLPMQGPQAGCWQFELEIAKQGRAGETYGYPALSQLDLGFRMFMRDPDFPEKGENFYLSSHRYPFFNEQSDQEPARSHYREKVDFQVSLDLLYPLLATRSFFALQPLAATDAFKDLGYASAFRTNLGYTVHLLPTATSRFVFALRPAKLQPEEAVLAPFYLVPTGKFGIKIPNYSSGAFAPSANIICGVSGLEYLKVSDGSSFIFTAGQPAYSPAYVSVQSLLRDLTSILENYSSRKLPPDTTDLDMKIEKKSFDAAVIEPAVGISEADRLKRLETIRQQFFPPDFTFPATAVAEYKLLETAEDIVAWLQRSLDLTITEPALDITDTERLQILEIIRQNYFPPDYRFTKTAQAEYESLEIVEDLVNWLQRTLQSVTLPEAAGKKALEVYPTTAWTYVEEAGGAVYYAQPDQAVLYRAEASSREFLDYMEVPSVGLPAGLLSSQVSALRSSTGYDVLAFPMLPYGQVDPHSLTDILQLEILLLNNFRRNRIQEISAATAHSTRLTSAQAATSQTGTTPQGLIATYSTDYKTIDRLQLAKDTKNNLLQLAKIQHGSSLKACLQSNQLFMVMTDPGAVGRKMKDGIMAQFLFDDNTLDIQDWVFELGASHWKKKGTIFIFKFHDKPLLDLAAQPELWSLPDDFNADKNSASQKLLAILKTAVEIGKSSDANERRKYELLARAATQANWTGILALNVDVPLRNLPDALKALAGGMDPDKFYSQYVGVEVTPVKSSGDVLAPQQSSLFGLIDYKNPQIPLADASGYNFHVPLLTVVFQNSQIVAFAAEVLIIMDKLFAESTTLRHSKDGRNILTLKGTAEEHDGKIAYSFGFSGENVFQLSGKVVEEVEIVKAQFATDPIIDPAIDLALTGTVSGTTGSTTLTGMGTRFRAELGAGHQIRIGGVVYEVASITSDEALTLSVAHPLDVAVNRVTAFTEQPLDISGRFFFWGHMRFVYNHKFDILSFGATPGIAPAGAANRDYLNWSNLQISMGFRLSAATVSSPGTVTNKVFRFKPDHMAFDLDRSGWRLQSLYEKFPLKFTSFKAVAGDAEALKKSGFMPVKSPLTAVELGDSWYGMTFDLNLGSLGALAGGAGLVVSILAAWVPEQEGVYVGLKLPGSTGGKKEITVQGLLKISFKSIQFVIYPIDKTEDPTTLNNNTERQVGYLLKLKNIVLKFFVLSFPPSGQTEIILFGDPRDEVERKDKLLGWYAAYAKQ